MDYYIGGKKRCTRCEIWYLKGTVEGYKCPSCNFPLRTKTHKSRSLNRKERKMQRLKFWRSHEQKK